MIYDVFRCSLATDLQIIIKSDTGKMWWCFCNKPMLKVDHLELLFLCGNFPNCFLSYLLPLVLVQVTKDFFLAYRLEFYPKLHQTLKICQRKRI